LARGAARRKSATPYGFELKIPKHSPLNYLLIGQIGFEFAQKCANLIGFGAGDAKLHNSKANTRTAHKSLIPSVLACYGGRSKTNGP
jgi:hypothetical protein